MRYKQKETCIIVHGPTVEEHIKTIKESWLGHPIIFSTWEGSEQSCYDSEDIVLYVKDPGPACNNVYRQSATVLAGIEKAKEFGFTRAVKWRIDFVCNNADKLLAEIFDKRCLNLYSYDNTPHTKGYIMDFFMEGTLEDIRSLWTLDSTISYPFAEKAITKTWYDNKLNERTKFIIKELTEDNNIFWKKHNYWFTDHNPHPVYLNYDPTTSTGVV